MLTLQKQVEPSAALEVFNPGYELIEIPAPSLLSFLKSRYKPNFNQSQSRPNPKKKNLLKRWGVRVFDYLRFKKGIFNACRMPDFSHLGVRPALKAIRKKGHWDLVVSTAGPYPVHMIAEKLKREGLAGRWIADYRDTWSNNYIYPGLFPFNIYEKYLEKKLLRSVDAITTVSDPFSASFSERYGTKCAFTVENGFDPDELEDLPKTSFFPEDGKYRIVHMGSIYQGKRDPTPLFQAIQAMAQDPALKPLLNNLEVVFAGTRQANLEELIARYGINNWVKSYGCLAWKQSLHAQRDAHALLFLPWNDLSVDGVLTGKIFEYLFSGTPIMAVGGNGMEASQELILKAKAGIAFKDASQIKDFLQAKLQVVTKEKNVLDEKFLNNYSRKNLAMKLLEINAGLKLRKI